MDEPKPDQRIVDYISHIIPVPLNDDPVDTLIASHRRQRELVGEMTEAWQRCQRRLWFLPWRAQLWVRGDRR